MNASRLLHPSFPLFIRHLPRSSLPRTHDYSVATRNAVPRGACLAFARRRLLQAPLENRRKITRLASISLRLPLCHPLSLPPFSISLSARRRVDLPLLSFLRRPPWTFRLCRWTLRRFLLLTTASCFLAVSHSPAASAAFPVAKRNSEVHGSGNRGEVVWRGAGAGEQQRTKRRC